jgi:ABC-type nitrate/sulfonate/bicarbonate transport system substrate-binding protein
VRRVDQGGVPPYDELLLVASSDRLAHDSDYRAAVRGAVAAIDAGGRWAQAHPAGAAAIVRKASGQAAAFVDASTRATLRLVRQRGGSTCLHPAAWRAFGAWLAARRLVPHPVAAGDVMTTRYLPKSCAG